MRYGTKLLLMALLVLPALVACVSKPAGVEPVRGFELQRYLGKWYEVARLDHSFERGLSRVTADYSLREDGGVRVLNRGYSAKEGAWDEAEGRAYFVEDEATGYLKVSFFGPFYGAYIVFELDSASYQYAFVSGPNSSYLWLLARSPVVSDEVKVRFLEAASARGFDTSKLIWVDHSTP